MDNFNQSNIAQLVPRGQAQPTHTMHSRAFALSNDKGAGCGALNDGPLNDIVLDGGCEGTNILGRGIPFAQLNWPVPKGQRSPDQMPIFGSRLLYIPINPMPVGRPIRTDFHSVPRGAQPVSQRTWMGSPLRPDPVGHGMSPAVPGGPRQPRQQAVMGCPSTLTYIGYRVYGTIIH